MEFDLIEILPWCCCLGGGELSARIEIIIQANFDLLLLPTFGSVNDYFLAYRKHKDRRTSVQVRQNFDMTDFGLS